VTRIGEVIDRINEYQIAIAAVVAQQQTQTADQMGPHGRRRDGQLRRDRRRRH
jgi:hypothetical protein